MSTPLRVVAAAPSAEASFAIASPASLNERIQQLQAEAKGLAREHIALLGAGLLQTQQMAVQIADGGDAYPPGVREMARRISEDSAARAHTLEAIMARL